MGIIATNMYFGRNIYKQLLDIYNIKNDYDWKKAVELDYISGGNLVLMNGGYTKTKDNAMYHSISALKQALFSEFIEFDNSLINVEIYNDIQLNTNELDERHFAIYYKIFHQISFNDKRDILSQFLLNTASLFQEKSDYFAHHQLVFKYPLYSYDSSDKLQIETIGNDDIVKLSNPYHCDIPYIPGIECIYECQWGYTSICPQSFDPKENIDASKLNPYQIKQFKQFINIKWSQDPIELTKPQCCSVAQICSQHSQINYFYSPSNPSLIPELRATAIDDRGGVQTNIHSETFPFDIQSESIRVKCKSDDLILINRGLMSDDESYSRFCQFRDIEPHNGYISGPTPDCRGPKVFSSSNQALSKPLIWEETKSFLLNDFQCDIDEESIPYLQRQSLNTIRMFARVSTENSQIYKTECDIFDSFGNIKFAKNTLLFKDEAISIAQNSEFPAWNDMINIAIVYSFGLPLGLWIDESLQLKGFPFSSFKRNYNVQFCVSNIAQNNVQFDKRNCIDLKMEVVDPPPIVLYYPLNAHEFDHFDSDKSHKMPLNQRHILQIGQSFDIHPIIEPQFLLNNNDNDKRSCSMSDNEIIHRIFYETDVNSGCDIEHDCIGNINRGFSLMEYSSAKHIAIFNKNQYFELLNVNRDIFKTEHQALDEGIRKCKLICSLDKECKSIVLTINDHRRIPNKQILYSLSNDNVYICDVFYDIINNMIYDRFEQSNSFYFEKIYRLAPPLFLKYEKIKCKDAMTNDDNIIRGLSVGFCADDDCNICDCIVSQYQHISDLKPLHYNLDFTSDVRIKHPNVDINIPKTCFCQTKTKKEDLPLIDAMFGTSAECINKGFSKQGLNINHGLIPFLIDLPPIFLCIKPWDIAEPKYTLSNVANSNNGLNIKDIKRFLDLFQFPAQQIPLNKFIKVPFIESRGFAVLPKFYRNTALNVDLKDIGWNCYHSVAENNEYVTELNFIQNRNNNILRYNALPKGFAMDSVTGKIWSESIPRTISSLNVELQRYGHVSYHKCVVIYCNTAGCIANNVRFEILPSVPMYNPRHLDFYDRNKERELLSGQIRWETVPYLDGYDDTHHFDIWIDDGLNLDHAVKLYSSVIKYNEAFTSSKEQTQINNVYYRRGYRFLVIISCSTLWCFNEEYNITNNKMLFDDNAYYTENTNILEFFDYGDKPFYPILNITSDPFIDLDGNEAEIAGIITFIPPKLYEHQIYKLYVGICSECRNYLIASIKWISPNEASPKEMIIPYNTKIYDSKYMILITSNEYGENDKNVYIHLMDEIYNCNDWNPCDKSCLISDYKNNNNSIPITSNSKVLPWSSCVTNTNIKRECHRFVCPLSKLTIWPKHTNFKPQINYQIQTNRGYVTALYYTNKALYIYQKYSFKQSRSKLKVTIFKDRESCKDRLSFKQCRDLIKHHTCVRNPIVVLTQCQYSCGACQSKWDIIQIPSHHNNETFTHLISVPITTNIYIREIFIRSDITGYIDDHYLVSVNGITSSNHINISIMSVANKYGWETPLQLIYVIDTIQPIYKEIEYDANIVNQTLYQRYNESSTQYQSMIPINIELFSDLNHEYGLIKVEIISYFDASFNTNSSWSSLSNVIFITILREKPLSLINKECLFYYVEYDDYDKWLTQSFDPQFNDNIYFYSIFDENPGNKFGELHLYIGCHSNLKWFIQIGVEDNWKQWLIGGFNKLRNSDRFLTEKLNEKTGSPFIEELRRYLIKIGDIDKLVPKDEGIKLITNISIKLIDETDGYSDTYVLSCVRLADLFTIKPMLIKPEYGDIVPTGFLISYIIKEDPYKDTLELIIKPRESVKYVTDEKEERMIKFRQETWIAQANIKHSIKFCSKLENCINTEMKRIIKSIEPSDNLIEFSLYDFVLRYKDRWNNAIASDTVNDIMIVRDWTQDLYVLRVIYDSLNGNKWFVQWNIDNDNNYCDNKWFGIKCNSLKQIVSLNLFSNNLYGELPLEIGKLSSLEYLDLSSNYITGTIPITIQLLHIAKYISFSSNSLIGSIPNGLENMNNLNTLNLAGNMLSGTIPNGLLLSAKQSNLKNIYLNGNRLTAFIPNKFKDINDLNILYLADNDWFCLNYRNVDYSKWAKNTDYTSINQCIQPPKNVLQSDIQTPIDII